MASAGRILIMPKGNYDASTTYEMLDLVYYNETSWLAKKTVVGIEPSDASSEYWHKVIGGITPKLIGAVQNDIWLWINKPTDSLFSYIMDRIDEGYTSGTVQIESIEGPLTDISERIKTTLGSYLMCTFQKHYFGYVRVTLWGDGTTYEYKNWALADRNGGWAIDWIENLCPEGFIPNNKESLKPYVEEIIAEYLAKN